MVHGMRATAWLAAAVLFGTATGVRAFYHDMGAVDDTPSTVEVTLTEWRVETSTRELATGPIVFRIVNAGRYPHALALETADGGVDVAGRTLAAGQEEELTVSLPAGTYRLVAYCPIPGHREQGMETVLEVR